MSTSRRRANLVAVAVLVVALVGALAWDRWSGEDASPSRGPARADPGAVDGARSRVIAAQVRALGRAWDARDRDAFVTSAGGTDAARTLGAQVYDALGALDVRDLSMRLVSADDGPGPGLVDAAVAVSWTPSAGSAPARPTDDAEVELGFERRGDGWDLRSAAPSGEDPLPLWLAGPVRVESVGDARLVVVGDSGTDDAGSERLRTLVRDGVTTVRDVLPRTSRAPLVVAPTTTEVAAELLGQPATGLTQLAAVTTTPDGRADTEAGSMVVLNPTVFDRLDEADARLVVTHELTHALSDVSRGDAPLWVVEGFADWVALGDDDRPDRELAAQALAGVRRDGVPAALPQDQQFDAGSGRLGATYELAWSVFEVLEQAGGSDAVVAFYESVRDGATVDDALERRFDLDQAELLMRWQAWLRERA